MDFDVTAQRLRILRKRFKAALYNYVCTLWQIFYANSAA